MTQQVQTTKREDRRIAPVISWMIPVPEETDVEFAAFQSWIAAGDDAMPLDILKAHDLLPEVADRNAWIERRDHRFSHERLLRARVVQRLQMDQVEELRTLQKFYVDEIKRLRVELETQLSGEAPNTIRSVRLLREEIAEAARALRGIVDATARIHSSLDGKAGISINNSTRVAAAGSVTQDPDENKLAMIFKQMDAIGKRPVASIATGDGEIIDSQATEVSGS